MKTMTCRQLGGPCDLPHSGNSADEVIKTHDRHLREAVRTGDAAHLPAGEAMKGRWRRPRQSFRWYGDTKRAFAQQPERPGLPGPGAGRHRTQPLEAADAGDRRIRTG